MSSASHEAPGARMLRTCVPTQPPRSTCAEERPQQTPVPHSQVHTQPLVESLDEPHVQPDINLWRQVTVRSQPHMVDCLTACASTSQHSAIVDISFLRNCWQRPRGTGSAADAARAEAAREGAAQLLLEPHARHHVRAPPAVHDDAGALTSRAFRAHHEGEKHVETQQDAQAPGSLGADKEPARVACCRWAL